MNRVNINLKEDDLINFIWSNFKENALLEISYNRVFIPGKILFIDNQGKNITLQLKGELLNQTINIDIPSILHEIIEIRYTFKNKTTIITVVD